MYYIFRFYHNKIGFEKYYFNSIEELYEVPFVKEQVVKDGFSKIGWRSWYSICHLVIEFIDGHNEEIASIHINGGEITRSYLDQIGLVEIPPKKLESFICIDRKSE